MTTPGGLLAPLPSWNSEKSLATFYNNLYRGAFQGREMQKCADDLARYQEIIDDTEPEVIVEVGTRYGGSALWFHHNSSAKVITIDITKQQMNSAQLRGDEQRGIRHLVGDSTSKDILDAVRFMADGKRTMVSLDGDHHAPKVWEEIQAYGTVVTKGCFLVVEDAAFDLWTGDDSRRGGKSIPEVGGPLKAMQLAGMANHPYWKRDEAIEAWTEISHSPCGWWERV